MAVTAQRVINWDTGKVYDEYRWYGHVVSRKRQRRRSGAGVAPVAGFPVARLPDQGVWDSINRNREAHGLVPLYRPSADRPL
jgi:hypothetical protein